VAGASAATDQGAECWADAAAGADPVVTGSNRRTGSIRLYPKTVARTTTAAAMAASHVHMAAHIAPAAQALAAAA
jgi:hypothetical protein